MENEAFALMEQMLHFLQYFQIYDISKASKGVIMELRVHNKFPLNACDSSSDCYNCR